MVVEFLHGVVAPGGWMQQGTEEDKRDERQEDAAAARGRAITWAGRGLAAQRQVGGVVLLHGLLLQCNCTLEATMKLLLVVQESVQKSRSEPPSSTTGPLHALLLLAAATPLPTKLL